MCKASDMLWLGMKPHGCKLLHSCCFAKDSQATEAAQENCSLNYHAKRIYSGQAEMRLLLPCMPAEAAHLFLYIRAADARG